MAAKSIPTQFEDISRDDSWARTKDLLRQFNNPALSWEESQALLPQMFAQCEGATATPPLFMGGGRNIRLGKKVYINQGLTISGGAPVSIGDYTLIAPWVQIHATTHPVDPWERQQVAFTAKPISIGENVWIGAGAIICPGVTIGDHAVIAAGAVVSQDVARCTLVAGNPAQVVRQLDEPDMATIYAKREG
ncbi:sugar O-acetyltransferase [Silvimonas sp.]|uniref:sugar O-acetyltransferase n=1 Tax=Silvimonas sp. TaxID=2650811 RepID=UPI00283D7A12|nr:sugar O-acetyltransferase [Silvimonas sp.]MDR3429897.1 sugar O-acetyltransferase [Silvimonas sp.]